MRKAFIVLLCYISSSALAQVTYVAARDTVGASVSSVTIHNYTIASGDNRLLIVGIGVVNDGSTGNLAISSVTFNGVAMTQVCNGNVADDSRAWIYKLVAPDITTANIVVTFGAATAEWINVGAANFTGVDQTTPCGTCASDTDDNTTYSISVSSATNDLVVDMFVGENSTNSTTPGSGQTANWNRAIGAAGGAGASSRKAGASSVTMSWTDGATSSHRVLTGVSLKAAASSPSTRRVRRPILYN